MRAERGLGSVLVVDVDLHQGNGTAVIYADDAATFTYSIHQGDIYPPKERSSLDRHLQAGVGDVDYLALLASDLDAVDRQITPDLVCFLAGVDPYRHDQLGGLDISAEGLARRDRLVLERYVGRGIPVAVFLAGGYARSPEETAKLHLATIEAAEDVCR
jgi:acetoin utilization deacetylase AcuC-like enzyme